MLNPRTYKDFLFDFILIFYLLIICKSKITNKDVDVVLLENMFSFQWWIKREKRFGFFLLNRRWKVKPGSQSAVALFYEPWRNCYVKNAHYQLGTFGNKSRNIKQILSDISVHDYYQSLTESFYRHVTSVISYFLIIKEP